MERLETMKRKELIKECKKYKIKGGAILKNDFMRTELKKAYQKELEEKAKASAVQPEPSQPSHPEPTQQAGSKVVDMAVSEHACTYAAVILQDHGSIVTGDKIDAILKATNIIIEPYWPPVFAKLCEKKDVKSLLANAVAVPAAVAKE